MSQPRSEIMGRPDGLSVRVATWNVNGIRARQGELLGWLEAERPDVMCLQELKAAPDQLPPQLAELPGYWSAWHGQKGYSGVGLLIRHGFAPAPPSFHVPPFDFECRILAADLPGLTVASTYVPNGGKDFPAKLRFLESLEAWLAERLAGDAPLILGGDLNITRSDLDVHPKERNRKAIGQLPEERALLERLLSRGLTDVARTLAPEHDALFTWWAPWRSMRARDIGWRIDYLLASTSLAPQLQTCQALRGFGSSDHAPVLATLAGAPEGVGPDPGRGSGDPPGDQR